MKYRDGQGKYVLREAMRDALPAEILDRPKQGFGSPMEEWLRGDFGRDAQAAVRGSALAERELLDYDVVDRLFAAHRRGPRRLEQAPVEPLLRQQLVRPMGRPARRITELAQAFGRARVESRYGPRAGRGVNPPPHHHLGRLARCGDRGRRPLPRRRARGRRDEPRALRLANACRGGVGRGRRTAAGPPLSVRVGAGGAARDRPPRRR